MVDHRTAGRVQGRTQRQNEAAPEILDRNGSAHHFYRNTVTNPGFPRLVQQPGLRPDAM